MSLLAGLNIPLSLKRIFLSFTQAYFAEHPRYRWQYDITKTGIVIADRNATETGIAVKRPSIILTRGDLSWLFMPTAQDGINATSPQDFDGYEGLKGHRPNVARDDKKSYTDLMSASLIFNVLSKNGIEAETIANELFAGITGYKEEFRKAGIHKFTSLSIGAERLIKIDADVHLTGVPVQVSFLTQQKIVKDEAFHYSAVSGILDNGSSVSLYESHDYNVITNGTQIQLTEQPTETITMSINYTDAITLLENSTTLVATADPTVFDLEDSGSIAGYYNLLDAFNRTFVPSQTDADYLDLDTSEYND